MQIAPPPIASATRTNVPDKAIAQNDNTYEHDTRPGVLTDAISDALRIEFGATYYAVDSNDWRTRHEPPRHTNTSRVTTDSLEDAMQLDADDAMESHNSDSDADNADMESASSGRGDDSDETAIKRELASELHADALIGAPIDRTLALVLNEEYADPEMEPIGSPHALPTHEWPGIKRF